MSVKTEKKPFSELWWKEFIKNSSHMTYPVVVEDVITHDVEDLKACIYEMFQNLNNENDTVAWGIWVEGEEDIALRAKLINDPIKGEKDLLSWQKRNFGDKKFGIILNRAQRYSEKLRNVISNYFEPFLDEKTPFGGISFSVFMGNYGWTPLGIHEDNTGSFVMHFHLGPGDKTMYMWERSNYEKTLGGTQNNRDVKSYIPFVDYTCNFKQGDIFFMPWNYYHIGKSDDLSIGLTVRFNYTNVDGLLNGVWRSGLKEITDEELSDNIVVPNMQSIEDSAALDQIISQLEEEVNEMSINDFLLEQLDDYSDALRSNGWYDSGDIKRKKESVELEENTKVKINKSKIRYKRSGDSIKFFHRGDKLSFHYHEDMEKLITLLNTGEANTALALLDNLFTDWPEGIGVRLLEILCENDVLLIIE